MTTSAFLRTDAQRKCLSRASQHVLQMYLARAEPNGNDREGHNRGQVIKGEDPRTPRESRLLTDGSRSSARSNQSRVTNDKRASALYRSGVGGPISVRRLKPLFSPTTGQGQREPFMAREELESSCFFRRTTCSSRLLRHAT